MNWRSSPARSTGTGSYGEIAPATRASPGLPTRFANGLLLLKQIYGLSDEGVCERWVYDPYFQFFTGEEFFQHEFPHERSDLSHWRKRLSGKLELLLAESLQVAHASAPLRSQGPQAGHGRHHGAAKNIDFPTDAKLLHAAIKGLNRLANKHGVRLRQSYVRVARHAAMMARRYAHAKQFNRHRRQLRILRSSDGLIRDIGRKIAGHQDIEAAFALRWRAPVRSRPATASAWLEALFLHAPETECIGKGKASAPYEFGVQVSIVTTNARAPGGQFVLHAKALPGKPRTTGTPCATSSTKPKTHRARDRARLCRQGYRGPRYAKYTPSLHLGTEARRVRRHQKRELRRRSAIEPVIGHLKAEGHLGRCYLKGRAGGRQRAILSAVGYNFRRILAWLGVSFCAILKALLPYFASPAVAQIGFLTVD